MSKPSFVRLFRTDIVEGWCRGLKYEDYAVSITGKMKVTPVLREDYELAYKILTEEEMARPNSKAAHFLESKPTTPLEDRVAKLELTISMLQNPPITHFGPGVFPGININDWKVTSCLGTHSKTENPVNG